MTKQYKNTDNNEIEQVSYCLDSLGNLTPNEYKLLMLIISQINSHEEESETLRITVKDFADFVGIRYRNIYRGFKAAIDRLSDRIVVIHHPEKKLLTKRYLIDSVNYYRGNGYVDIKISSETKTYLIELKKSFTQRKMFCISKLSSTYAIQLYELLKRKNHLKQISFSIDSLRRSFNIPDKTFKAFCHFRIKVLEIAQREINKKTDITIDYSFQKTGRKITTVIFDVQPNQLYGKENKNNKTKKRKPSCFFGKFVFEFLGRKYYF